MRIKSLLKLVYRKLPLKRHVYQLMRRVGAPPERLYRHLHFEGPMTVSVDDARSFRMLSFGTKIENELFWSGFGGKFEGVSLKVWARLAEQATAAILDVGANTGIYSLAARTVNKVSPIFAFEPIPALAARLRRNIALNQYDVSAVEKAVSDVDAIVSIYDNAEPGYDASLEPRHGNHSIAREVEAITLETFIAVSRVSQVDLIKLDVEEHEPAVVRGAMTMIKNQLPAMLIETIFEKPTAELNQQLLALDYLIFNIDEERGLIPADRLGIVREDSWNNLLCRRDVFEAARLSEFVRS